MSVAPTPRMGRSPGVGQHAVSPTHTKKSNCAWGDRATDPRRVVDGRIKPAVLSRRAVRLLCLACLGLIVYGTLGPLGLGRRPWIVPPSTWTWTLPLERSDANDLLTNFVVYLPVGIALRLLLRRRGSCGWSDLLLATMAAGALSYLTEVLQQAMPIRSSNAVDVIVNTAAAFVGALLASPVQRLLRTVHEAAFRRVHHPARLWSLLAAAAILTLAAWMTLPWQPGPWRAVWGFDEPLGAATLRRFILFGAVGFLVAGARRVRGLDARTTAIHSAALVSGLACLLEASQCAFAGHVSSCAHALIQTCGGTAGALLGTFLVRPLPTSGASATVPSSPVMYGSVYHCPALRGFAWAAIVMIAGWTLVLEWRATPPPSKLVASGVAWVPFAHAFEHSFTRAVSEAGERLAVFVGLTLLCLFLDAKRGRALAMLLLVGLLGTVHAVRLLQGAAGDTTPLVLALLGWLFACRIWDSLHPAPHHAVQPSMVHPHP